MTEGALVPDAVHEARPAAQRALVAERALVVIPTYNERINLPLIVPQILQQDPRLEVLVVDDNSPDGTGRLADEMAAAEPRVHVLHRPGKAGLGKAYLAGFRWALDQGYDLIFEMDADFSHDPKFLPDFLRAIEHADLVLAPATPPGSMSSTGPSAGCFSRWGPTSMPGGSPGSRSPTRRAVSSASAGRCSRPSTSTGCGRTAIPSR